MSIYYLLRKQTANVSIPPLSQVQPIITNIGQPAPYQAITATVSGVGTVQATIQPVVSNDGVNWSNYGSTIVLNGTAPQTGNVVPSSAPFTYWGATLSGISGTSASVDCILSA